MIFRPSLRAVLSFATSAWGIHLEPRASRNLSLAILPDLASRLLEFRGSGIDLAGDLRLYQPWFR